MSYMDVLPPRDPERERFERWLATFLGQEFDGWSDQRRLSAWSGLVGEAWRASASHEMSVSGSINLTVDDEPTLVMRHDEE